MLLQRILPRALCYYAQIASLHGRSENNSAHRYGRQSRCQESASTCRQLASERPINDIIERRRAHVPGTYDRHNHPDLWNN